MNTITLFTVLLVILVVGAAVQTVSVMTLVTASPVQTLSAGQSPSVPQSSSSVPQSSPTMVGGC